MFFNPLIKVTINARIVVVGASDVGIAFLETFVYWLVSANQYIVFVHVFQNRIVLSEVEILSLALVTLIAICVAMFVVKDVLHIVCIVYC